jgi:hypothetical protein
MLLRPKLCCDCGYAIAGLASNTFQVLALLLCCVSTHAGERPEFLSSRGLEIPPCHPWIQGLRAPSWALVPIVHPPADHGGNVNGHGFLAANYATEDRCPDVVSTGHCGHPMTGTLVARGSGLSAAPVANVMPLPTPGLS